MKSLEDFIATTGVTLFDETCSDFEDGWTDQKEERWNSDIKGLSDHGFKGLIRLIQPVPINRKEGDAFLCQIYWGADRKFSSATLEGCSAIRLKYYTFVDSFVYLEFQFVPREARPYRSVCVFVTDENVPIRVDVIGVGYDPRIPLMPMRIPVPDILPNILSKCNFNHPYLNVNQGTVLLNEEASFSALFNFPHIPPMVIIQPINGELNPGSSVKITVHLRNSEYGGRGNIFIPCTISFRLKPRSLTPMSQVDKSTKDDVEEVFACHKGKPILQSISRVICSKRRFPNQSVCEKSTRSRDAKLSLECRMKMFERGDDEFQPPPDHYLGILVFLGGKP